MSKEIDNGIDDNIDTNTDDINISDDKNVSDDNDISDSEKQNKILRKKIQIRYLKLPSHSSHRMILLQQQF